MTTALSLTVGDRVFNTSHTGAHPRQRGVITEINGPAFRCWVEWDSDHARTTLGVEKLVRETDEEPQRALDLKTAMKDLQHSTQREWLTQMIKVDEPRAIEVQRLHDRIRALTNELDGLLIRYGDAWLAAAEYWRKG